MTNSTVDTIYVYLQILKFYNGDIQKTQRWLGTYHDQLQGVPAELLSTSEGLEKVSYLIDKVLGDV